MARPISATGWRVIANVLSLYGVWPAAPAVALVAAAMKETTPVFAACFCLNPLLLLALTGPLVRRLSSRGGEDTHNSKALADPIGSARRVHAEHLFDPAVMLAPWGIGVLAVLAHDRTIAVIVALAVLLGCGQAVVRRNEHRAPVSVGGASGGARRRVGSSPRWEPAAPLVHLFNPLAGGDR